MSGIQTNKIVAGLNSDELSKAYEVYNIKTSDPHFGKGNNAAKLVDDFTNEKFVLSVVYERGNSFFILLKRAKDNLINLNKALKSLKGIENISMEVMSISMVPQNVMVQLLLNSLGTYEGKNLGFHNVTGHFYIHHPSWKKSKDDQIVTLELKVSKDMVLDWNVRTFTSIKLKKYISFNKKKSFSEYPEYEFGKDFVLKRIEKGSNPEAYILRQIGDKKSNIKFLDIESLEKFQKTKMGVICDCIDKFNAKFNGMAHIEFGSFSDYKEVEISTNLVRAMEHRFDELAGTHKVVLVDNVIDSTSGMCIDELKEQLIKRFKCKVSILKKPKADAINIVLIHEDEHYEKKNLKDPHDIDYKGCAVQHVTIETIAHLMGIENEKEKISGWKSILDCLMQEVLIKEDIVNKHITMVNWSEYGYTDSVDFGICHKNEDESKHFFFMSIKPNGDFTITEQENTLFEQNEYQECIDIFEKEDVVGVVRIGENINIIHNTKLRTVPEIELIKERLTNNDNKIRDKESRVTLFPAVTDIKSFAENDHSLHYFSGIIGAGMRRVISTAANVRKVDCYRFCSLFFDNLLKLMAVTFVRNGQLTVMPFPFKYLAEFIYLK